ncbi:hypothetical protein K523DRAFT_322894 [Schizophyllum commune Tattone D]|nr:hypothetical protein K523DRAFT_322894 [Schizophyllum commune Tattone D]
MTIGASRIPHPIQVLRQPGKPHLPPQLYQTCTLQGFLELWLRFQKTTLLASSATSSSLPDVPAAKTPPARS